MVRERGRRITVLLVVVALLVVAGGAVGAVALVRHLRTTPQERYCSEVVARREALSRELSGGAAVGLLDALPTMRDLRDAAPDDVADEWRQLVDALTGLRDALDDAGVDASTYDRDDPPAGVTAAQRSAIDAAATVVGSQQTRTALLSLDQQARDVCGTPLVQ